MDSPPLSPLNHLISVAGPEAASAAGDLRGRFHSHVTLGVRGPDELDRLAAFCAARPRVKLTVIDLADFTDRAQRDVMTTRYHYARRPGELPRLVGELAELGLGLERAGFEVLRFKLEHEGAPTLPRFSEERYREVHIKLRLPERDDAEILERLRALGQRWGFVPSRNPNERAAGWVHRFVNLRIYEGDAAGAAARVDRIAAALAAAGLEILEIKQETTVLDTGRAHDAWWA
jgi:hypothetical protein